MALMTGAALLPAVALAVMFRPSTQVSWLNHEVGKSSLRDDLLGLLQFQTMVSYRKAEGLLGASLVAVFAALSLFALLAKTRRRARSLWDLLLLVPLGLVVVYLRASDATSIHFYIPPRVMYFAFLILGLWLAAQPFPRVVRGAVPLFCAILALGFVGSHATKYRQFAPQLAEYVAAGEKIEPGSTFLPLVYAPQGRGIGGRPLSSDVAPFYMASGYVAVARGAVDLRNYEGRTDHFPVRFKVEVNPFEKLTEGNGLEQIPPRVEFGKFKKAGGRVDYVLIWGRAENQTAQAWAEALLESAMRAAGSLDRGAVRELFAAAERARDSATLERDLLAKFDRIALPGARWTELWKRK